MLRGSAALSSPAISAYSHRRCLRVRILLCLTSAIMHAEYKSRLNAFSARKIPRVNYPGGWAMFEWHNRRIYRDFMLMRIKKILARLLISASFLLLAAMVSMAQVPLHGE